MAPGSRVRISVRRLFAIVSLALSILQARHAHAAPDEVILTPVDEPRSAMPADLAPLSDELAALLVEAVRDFGLRPIAATEATPKSVAELSEWHPESWLLRPSLLWIGPQLAVRLAVRPPGRKVVSVREQLAEKGSFEIQVLGMLRDLLRQQPPTELASRASPPPLTYPEVPAAARSEGRAVLALHAAALGGYLGFALQRASGSNDARLTYPLAALGAGVGLGASFVVSDEWDVSTARAWYLGAGLVWPGLGTLLAIEPGDLGSASDEYIVGLLGAVGGVTLATASLSLGDVDEGGAVLTHSGGAFGLLLGGLSQMAIQGDTELMPARGMGIGAVVGSIVAGAVASQLETPSPSDLLFADLSALLGGLVGAAVGTPLLVGQDRSATRDRLWIASVGLGALSGGVLGLWLTRGEGSAAPLASSTWRLQPGHSGFPLGATLRGSF